MWSAPVTLLLSAFKWIFGGKDQTTGMKMGELTQTNTDLEGELSNVQKAQVARTAVVSDPAAIVRDANNAGPAAP
jgi:hypothetical protein